MTTVLQARRLVNARPCLEEIDGFLDGTRIQLGHIPQDVMAIVEEYRKGLLKGKVLPCESRLPRSFIYRRNRKPAPARAAVRRIACP